MKDTDPRLIADLARILSPDRVLTRPIDRLGRSVDASIYRLIPEVIVRPRDLDEVRALLAYVTSHGRHLTFRTAGTSLSGQAVTDDILAELAPYWKALRILDEGRRVWTQPGVVGGHLNRLLAPLGYRIGPDPASIDAAMIGGIVSNNSSGMCCGVVENSYHTVESMAFLLADGTLVDTARPDAEEALRRARPDLCEAILRLRDEVRGDAELSALLKRKFARKNTTGYSLNAFLDHDTPVQILAHLMVGSQGTLGFLADVTFRTIPELPARATGLLYFGDLSEAGAAVAPLAEAGAAALEIMDSASLRGQGRWGGRAYSFEIGTRTAALLVEFRTADDASAKSAVDRGLAAMSRFQLLEPPRFTTDPAERALHWELRKGIIPLAGAMRPSGTASVTEDIVVPVEQLAQTITDLQDLYARYGYSDAVTFGHAKDGNLHFVISQDFGTDAAVARYDGFMQDLVRLVVGKYDGAIKAEHGSGRNMAPFVRTEFGDKAYAVMQKVKALLDPARILNPGVLLNEDPKVHVKDLKPLPTISPLADRCIECGFCEPRCPSRDLTLTPRQRIVVTREIARLGALGTPEARRWRDALIADFAYEGIVTCAGDSMCQTSCPVKIDTGALIREIKEAAHPAWARRIANALAERFRLAAAFARLALRIVALVRAIPGGSQVLDAVTAPLHRRMPLYVPRLAPDLSLPRAASALPRPRGNPGAPRVVYFPSCLSRILGPLPGETAPPTPRAMLDVLEAAGFDVVYPQGTSGLCCGMPFGSKAFSGAARRAASRTGQALWQASREGIDPVVTDASPCAGTLRELALEALGERPRPLRILDFPAFWAGEALPRLGQTPQRKGTAVLHPTCTLVKMGGLPDLLKVARAHCESVMVPAAAECCGFAGDRGFLVPELTASATAREAEEVRAAAGNDAGLYSTCRTCEIGMTRAVGRPYRSIVHLVREALLGS